MASSSSTTTTSTRLSCEEKRMIKVLLLQGQKSAEQLQILLLHNNRDQPGFATAADAFVDQILTSFTETIHRIDHRKSKKRSAGGTSSTTTSSTIPSNLMMIDKRGCYKRRRCSETRTKVSPTMEDGQAWRKYGQKVILNSNFPRSYFRCTHKYDQGCKATKQVQAMEDNPQLYQTTYIGFHTCTSHSTTTPTLFAFNSSSETPNYNQQNVTAMKDLFSSTFDDQQPAVKEELEHSPNNKEQDTMSDLTDNLNSSTSFPGQLLHMDLDHVSQMYSFSPAFDDVTSQFDHPDFKIDDFFSDDPFTPYL